MSTTRIAEATAEIPEFTLAGKEMSAKVVACYDGDTFHAVIELNGVLWKFPCRMAGYDTPEMKPPKTKEDRETVKARAVKAKHALLTHVCSDVPSLTTVVSNKDLDVCVQKNRKVILLTCKEFDKYGRVLVSVPVDGGSSGNSSGNSGSVSDWMIREGYAYAYDGGTKMA